MFTAEKWEFLAGENSFIVNNVIVYYRLTVSQVSFQLQDLRDRHCQDHGVKPLAVSRLPLNFPWCTTAVQSGHMTLVEQIGSLQAETFH